MTFLRSGIMENHTDHRRSSSPLTVLVLFAFLVSASVPAFSAPAKRIGWRVDKELYMVYEGARLIDPFGFQVKRKDGVPDPRLVHTKELVPFYVGMVLPERRVSEGSSYRIKRKAPKFHPLVPLGIWGEGERKSDTEVDGHNVYHLHQKLQVKRKKAWVHNKHDGPFCKSGSVTADIYYDPKLGAVRKLVVDADLNFEGTGDVTGKQTYTLERHHLAGTNNFQKRVDEAIKKAVGFLKSEIDGGSSWDMGSSRGEYSKEALTLLALIESGRVKRSGDLVKSGMKHIFGKTDFSPPKKRKKRKTGVLEEKDFEELDKNYTHTYQEGLRMMLMEAYHNHQSGQEVSDFVKKLQEKKGGNLPDQFKEAKTKVPLADRDWMRSAVRWIFQSLNQKGGIRYTPEENSFDNSNNQYAALGMYAAQNLKIPIKNPAPLKRMLSHWIKNQSPRGPTVNMVLGQHQSDKTVPIRNASSRGWSYTNHGMGEPYGHFHSNRMHMTAGGVGSIRILRVYLKKLGALRGKLARASRVALRDGLAWMAKNWQLRPYPFSHSDSYSNAWHYYMLYGVERAAMLNNLSSIGGRKWYPQGSEIILTRPDTWLGHVVKTSFVILFLKRATSPLVITRD